MVTLWLVVCGLSIGFGTRCLFDSGREEGNGSSGGTDSKGAGWTRPDSSGAVR